MTRKTLMKIIVINTEYAKQSNIADIIAKTQKSIPIVKKSKFFKTYQNNHRNRCELLFL